MAEDGYRKSAVGQVRTYIKACFEYATDEGLIPKRPARKLVMPNIQKKSCERFLSLDELRALLSHAAPGRSPRGLRNIQIAIMLVRSFFQTQPEGRSVSAIISSGT